MTHPLGSRRTALWSHGGPGRLNWRRDPDAPWRPGPEGRRGARSCVAADRRRAVDSPPNRPSRSGSKGRRTTMTPYCWLVRRRLGAYQDGELSPGARSRVEAHVRRCEPCGRSWPRSAGSGPLWPSTPPTPPRPSGRPSGPRCAPGSPRPPRPPSPAWRRAWEAVRSRPRLALAPALAAAALAVVAVVAPWQRAPQHAGPVPRRRWAGDATVQPAALDRSSSSRSRPRTPTLPVMVYASPESDVTVLWVFGLPRTDT